MANSSPRIVLVHGVFDLFHAGHVEHLRQAKDFGEVLYVSVVPDRFALKRKPITPEDQRVAILQAIYCVNKVILCDGPGPENVIREVRPHIYVRSLDYAERREPELALLEELGIKLGFTWPLPIHTSDIIRRVKEST